MLSTFWAIGVFPFEGTIFPYGLHNAIPNSLRQYWYYFPKTNVPLPHFGVDYGNYPIYPLGMKALPNRHFSTIRRQLYRAILEADFEKIEKICDTNFDYEKEIIIPDLGLTAMGMAVSLNLLEVVHYFTLRGVDFEYLIGPQKKTALHFAVENGHSLMTKYLLKNGARIDSKDIYGHDVYDKINFRGLYDFKKFLDYFKNNPHDRTKVDYDEYRYTRDILLENLDTLSFKPSDILESSIKNTLQPINSKEKINLEKFGFYFFNQIYLYKLGKNKENSTSISYDSLKYYDESLL